MYGPRLGGEGLGRECEQLTNLAHPRLSRLHQLEVGAIMGGDLEVVAVGVVPKEAELQPIVVHAYVDRPHAPVERVLHPPVDVHWLDVPAEMLIAGARGRML